MIWPASRNSKISIITAESIFAIVGSAVAPTCMRLSMKKCLLTLILSLLVSPDCVQSQQPLVGLIQGKIIDQKQVPIPYAALTATNIDSVEPESHRRTTGADEKGFYEFVDVPEGRYSIVVKKTGYRDHKISVVTVRAGETVNMPDIKMSPRR
jgi:hypothetical protein